MSDPIKEKVEKPSFDPHKLLDQLKGIVTDNKDPAKGGGKSWLGTLIIIAVVLVGIAVWSWITFGRNRELARLRHEENKRKILKEQDELLVKVAEKDKESEALRKRIAAADKELELIDADIRAEEDRYEADMRAIDSIRSWRDAGIR